MAVDVKIFEVNGTTDLLAFGNFEDHPSRVGLVAQHHDQRRVIFFPKDPTLAFELIAGFMDIMGIEAVTKMRSGYRVRFGQIPRAANGDEQGKTICKYRRKHEMPPCLTPELIKAQAAEKELEAQTAKINAKKRPRKKQKKRRV